MLEMFLASLEESLGLLVRPPLAPIARMGIIQAEVDDLMRDAVEHCVEPSNAGAPLPEVDTSETAVRCLTCGGTRWTRDNPNFLFCANCLRAHPDNPF